ncbi:SMI1/KNR4 family protein [Calothrix sp. UHCC 0171]|uniref:SMI1/KNR4 family protein n=1 Tax=Calothrix sp. UHCC 0171 TaxID=3110245 RepID=UPI002B1F4AA5|nr:SMI1/KNR4 family protein [Calothrix sp. UHCC 0171]MEA5571535.1 SMI1/KNR4 family protein [Calothrix sp. UHCC 0171]
MNINFEKLKNKLSQLVHLDTNFEVFGSESHQYILNPCLSEKELQDFELNFQVNLPEDFRNFLLKIGNGGAGPGYGFLGLNIDNFQNGQLFQPDFLAQDFSLKHEWNDLDLLQEMNGSKVSVYFDQKFIQGSIAVAEYGCGIQARLVVTGEERGNIWIDDRTNEAGIYPLTSHCAAFFHDDPDMDTYMYESVEESKEALTFYEWYENWLNLAINQVLEFG